MTKSKVQELSITILSLFIIYLAWFSLVPGWGMLFLTLTVVALTHSLSWLVERRIFWSATQAVFNIHIKERLLFNRWRIKGTKGQITKFFEWMTVQDVGEEEELDFSGSPWLPKYVREYTIRYAVLYHTQRALLAKEKRRAEERKKKPTKRGKRGSKQRDYLQ